MLHEKFNTRIL